MPRSNGVHAVGAALAVVLFGASLHAANPSLCVEEDPRCSILDGLVHLRVQLGEAETLIVSGQFYLDYDPAVLEFLRIEPGSSCESESPFVLEQSEVVDPVAGRIDYGVRVDTIGGDLGTPGPATMACVTFIRRTLGSTDICLVELGFPNNTRLIDWQDVDVAVDNSMACPAALPNLSCESVASAGLSCLCGGVAPDCSHLDDACNIGECASGPPAARCVQNSRNEGGPCDDENTCTVTDRCSHGRCIGTDCPDPSLCVNSEPGCAVLGGLTRMRIELGEGEPVVSGGQFSIRYDPAALQFVSIVPGQDCDPTSPFSKELLTAVDAVNGVIQFAVGIAIGGGSNGTTGPATVACMSFIVLGAPSSPVCLFDEGIHFPARLVGYPGQAISIDNADTCYPPLPAPMLSCTDVSVSDTCTCGAGTADCSPLSDDCRMGFCAESPAHCEWAVANEGGGCDDENYCTQVDQCVGGSCRGTDCDNPSVCVVSTPSCPVLDGLARFQIRLGQGEPWVTQGQIALDFDPSVLELIDVLPGRSCDPFSPFELEYFESLDLSGRIQYAVGVHPFFPGTGTQGPATLACVLFRVIGQGDSDVCLVPGTNPFHSRLSDRYGNLVEVFNGDDCPSDEIAGSLSCKNLVVSNSCNCPDAAVDCSAQDGPCQQGVCTNGVVAQCVSQAANESSACYNGNPCKKQGVCTEGVCLTADCPTYPSLCVESELPCIAPGINEFQVNLGFAEALIVGVQFEITYDPSVIVLKDVSPGVQCDPTSPFVLEIFEEVDPVAGVIRYAVGVQIIDPDHGTHGPATAACLTFNRLTSEDISEVCIVEGVNPFYTRITAKGGDLVPIDNTYDCPTVNLPPALTCEPVCRIPTVSAWGLAVLTILLLTGAKLRSRGAE